MLILVASFPVALAVAVQVERARAEGNADAAVAVEPVRVRFDAPAGCPDGEEFLEQVRARTARVRGANEGEPARVFRVSVAHPGALFRGKLIVEETDHARRPRLVSGESCRDVVGALALIAALAVDPQALTGPTPSRAAPPPFTPPDGGSAPPDSAAPPAAVPADASTLEDAPTEPPQPLPALSATSTPSASSGSPRNPAPQQHGAPWVLSAGAAFDLVGAGTLGAVPGGSVFLDVSREGNRWFRQPTLRLGASLYGETSLGAGPASVRFAWTVGELDLCPVALRVMAFSVKPCLSTEIGALRAIPSGSILNAHDQLRPWFSAGAIAHFELRMSRFLAAEAHSGLRAPITRDDFVFQPKYPVYTAPSVMVTGGLGVGVHFP